MLVKPKGPPAGDSKQHIIARATACKKNLIATTSAATSLIHLIDTKQLEWARLNNSENQNVLARALAVLSDTMKENAFAQSVLACVIKGLRHDSSDVQMAVNLLDFVRAFEPLVTDNERAGSNHEDAQPLAMISKCWTLRTGEMFVGELVCLGHAQKRTERKKTSAYSRKWERPVQKHAMSFARIFAMIFCFSK